MRIKIKAKSTLNITFARKEVYKLTPGFYIYLPEQEPVRHGSKNMYKCYICNHHTHIQHKFNENGYFMATREVLARVFSCPDVVIF